MLSSPHTPPHAPGTLSPLPSRPARTTSTSPVLVLCFPRQKGLEPRCGGHPPPSYTSSSSCILPQVIDREADALPLFWEINSGGGVNCGASMYYDWKQFHLYAHFIGSYCFIANKLYSLSLHAHGQNAILLDDWCHFEVQRL